MINIYDLYNIIMIIIDNNNKSLIYMNNIQ